MAAGKGSGNFVKKFKSGAAPEGGQSPAAGASIAAARRRSKNARASSTSE
jgi:hypothetical protein